MLLELVVGEPEKSLRSTEIRQHSWITALSFELQEWSHDQLQ